MITMVKLLRKTMFLCPVKNYNPCWPMPVLFSLASVLWGCSSCLPLLPGSSGVLSAVGTEPSSLWCCSGHSILFPCNFPEVFLILIWAARKVLCSSEGNCCVLSDKDRVCEGLVIIFVWLLYIPFSWLQELGPPESCDPGIHWIRQRLWTKIVICI